MISAWWIILAFGGGFMIGLPVGACVKFLSARETIQGAFAWLILAVWVCSFMAAVVIEEYRTPFEIHAALGMVGGWLFGQGLISGIVRRNGGKKDEDKI